MNSSDSVSSQSNKSSTSLVASLPNENHAGTSGNADPWDDDDDITDSPNTSQAFMEAFMVMTLAEKFDLTRFRKYQKEAITAILSGQDCLVVQPTGSGKSLFSISCSTPEQNLYSYHTHNKPYAGSC